MFIISRLQEEISVPPADLAIQRVHAVTSVIEKNFIDKVVPNLGLIASLWDIETIEGGTIHPSEGGAQYTVTFRVVVFRPFEGEILVGQLLKSEARGVHVSLGFFEDVFIPESNLQEPSLFITEGGNGVWRWDFDGNQLFLDFHEQVRIRVKEVKFNSTPTPAERKEKGIGTPADKFKPMVVIGDMNGDGLGAVAWWIGAAPEDEEASGDDIDGEG